MKKLFLLPLIALGLGLQSHATITVEDFDSFSLGGTFASWDTAALLSGPGGFTVQSTGFGGGFFDINPNVDGSSEAGLQLDVTVNSDTSPTILAVLQDGDGTQSVFTWSAVVLGTSQLYLPYASASPGAAGSTPGFDPTTLDFAQIQIDDSDAYDVTFNNMSVVPEPASMALMLMGGIGLAIRRRRR